MGFSTDIYEKLGIFYLGRRADAPTVPVLYDSRDLLTHAVCLGMTGSGKTGLCVGLVEEAIVDNIPVIAIDPKGDISNLLLAFPELNGETLEPWVDADAARRKGMSVEAFADAEAQKWKRGLDAWGQSPERIRRMRESADFRIYTPGSQAGLPVSMLSSFDVPPEPVLREADLLSDRIQSTVSGLLGLLGIDADPLQSGEHVLLSNIVAHYWREGRNLDLPSLIHAIQKPPFDKIGILNLDDVFDAKARAGLAMRLNNLVAAPTFAAWLEGDPLDIDEFLYSDEGKPRVSIFSIAHLSESERMFFVSVLLDAIVGWMRTQSGTTSLRAMVYMDEIFGYLPPVAEPPSKKPMLTLLKQARAFGVGLVLATQNPVDIDYKALSNCGTWFLGRLQTERDRARVLDGLKEGAPTLAAANYDQLLASLEPRSFLLHNVHADAPVPFQTRWVMSYLRGPMTRDDIRRVMEGVKSTAPAHREPVRELEEEAPERQMDVTRPAIGDGINEYFMPIHVVRPEGSRLLYRPMMYGCGTTHFDDTRLGVDTSRAFGYIAPIFDGPIPIDWSRGFRVDFEPDFFSAEPPDDSGTYMDPPSVALDPKEHKAWQKSLVEHIYRNDRLELSECKDLKLVSSPTETRRAFVGRVQDAIRERRDDAFDALKGKYDKRIDKTQSQVRKLEDRLAREEAQLRDVKVDAALSFGGSLFDAFTGRSASSAARRAARSASRTQREASDVERARAALAEEMQEIHDLERQFKEEIARLADVHDIAHFPITTREIPPEKNDISLTFFSLVWVPYWVLVDGSKQRAV